MKNQRGIRNAEPACRHAGRGRRNFLIKKRYSAFRAPHSAFLLGLLLTVSHAPAAHAINSDWIGPGWDYNTPGNWDNGLPGTGGGGSADTAVFTSSMPTSISISGNVSPLGFAFNSAIYTLTIQSTVTLQLGSNSSNGIINNSGTTQTLINNGTVLLEGGTAVDVAIINKGTWTYIGTVSAGNATITNTGTMNFTGVCFLGSCNNPSGGNATIANAATLQVQAGATLGDATVVNTGTIDATGVTASTWSVGSISGSGSVLLGSHTIVIGSDNRSTTISGAISGTGGSLTKVGNGTLTLAGSNSYTSATTVNGGTLNLLSSLSSDVAVGAAGTLSGIGTIGNLVNSGTVVPGTNGVGALNASGYSGAGILNSSFNRDSHGALKITGNANITSGTLNITGSNFAVGQYSVLNANSLSGTFATFNGPASSLLSFAPAYSATDAFVLIGFATPFSTFAQNTNQRSVAANLNGPKNTSSTDFTNAINSVALLPVSQIPDALSQISGDSLASFQEVGLENAAMFTQGMRQRAAMGRASPDDWRAVSVSSGSYGLWAQGVGGVDTMNGDASLGSPASHANTGGFQAGYDYIVAEDILFGFSGGYAKTDLDVADRASSGNTQSIQSGVYANYTRGAWFANGAAAYTTESNDMTRAIRYGGINEQATGSFDSRLYTTFIETGYSFHRRNTLSIEPSLSLKQSHLAQDGFTESGAPGLGLTVADRSLNSVVSSLGVGLRRFFFQDAPHPLAMNASVAWEHELADTHDTLSAHFAETSGGSDFTVEGTPRSRDAAAIGLEGRVPLRENLELFGSYTATLASIETIQKLFGGVRFKW